MKLSVRLCAMFALFLPLIMRSAETGWWMTEPIRWVQTNLRETDAALDPDRLISQLSEMRANVLLIGMGGIASGRQAADLLRAGARCVAVGTESFRDPAAGVRIRTELVALVENEGPDRPVAATSSGDLRRD